MNQILPHVVISRCQQCQNTSGSITIDSVSCSGELPGAPLIRGHIETQDVTLSQRVFQSLEVWHQTGPVVFINGSWAAVDRECALLASEDSSQECFFEPTTTSTLPTPSFVTSTTFYVVVGAAGFVLIVVILMAILVCSCWCGNRSKNTAVANL